MYRTLQRRKYKLTFGFRFTLDSCHTVTSADQHIAQIGPLPLVIKLIELPILHASVWGGRTR